MRVIATKLFISTVYGNVSKGQIIDCTDVHGAHFMEHGLAKRCEPVEGPKADPTPPAAKEVTGSLSPAGQALPPKTVIKSEPGVTKVTKARPVRKSVKSRS